MPDEMDLAALMTQALETVPDEGSSWFIFACPCGEVVTSNNPRLSTHLDHLRPL